MAGKIQNKINNALIVFYINLAIFKSKIYIISAQQNC